MVTECISKPGQHHAQLQAMIHACAQGYYIPEIEVSWNNASFPQCRPEEAHLYEIYDFGH